MAKFNVGQIVEAKDDLTNSSGSIIRAKKGSRLRITGFGFTHDLLILEGLNGTFAAFADSVETVTGPHVAEPG